MNKAQLAAHLADKLGSRRAATTAIEAFVDAVVGEVARGGSVTITGFGVFEPSERAARVGRNPRTGQRVPVPPTTTPRFRPGSRFRDEVGGAS